MKRVDGFEYSDNEPDFDIRAFIQFGMAGEEEIKGDLLVFYKENFPDGTCSIEVAPTVAMVLNAGDFIETFQKLEIVQKSYDLQNNYIFLDCGEVEIEEKDVHHLTVMFDNYFGPRRMKHPFEVIS